jgi:hypothetical protein
LKKRIALGLLLVVAVAVAGLLIIGRQAARPDWARCTPTHPLACSTVEGVALGSFVKSWELDAPSCTAACGNPFGVARIELELRAPTHPTLAAIDEFHPDLFALCGDSVCKSSGFLGIFLFTFSDSSHVPIIVSCPPIATCYAIDRYGAG